MKENKSNVNLNTFGYFLTNGNRPTNNNNNNYRKPNKIIIIKIIKLLNENYSYLALENLLISAAICKLIPNPQNPILLNIILINLLLSGIINFIIKYEFFYL